MENEYKIKFSLNVDLININTIILSIIMKTIIIESIWAKPHLETAGEIALEFKNKNKDISFSWIGSDLFWHEWRIPKFLKLFGSDPKKKIDSFLKIFKKK